MTEPSQQSLLVLRGDFGHKNFWLIDLRTGAGRLLAELPAEFVIGDFDISPDGSDILFDRVQEDSELALIERAGDLLIRASTRGQVPASAHTACGIGPGGTRSGDSGRHTGRGRARNIASGARERIPFLLSGVPT